MLGVMALLDCVRDAGLRRHLARWTIACYQSWIADFLRVCREPAGRWRHPRDLGAADVQAYLTHLARDRCVSASTWSVGWSANERRSAVVSESTRGASNSNATFRSPLENYCSSADGPRDMPMPRVGKCRQDNGWLAERPSSLGVGFGARFATRSVRGAAEMRSGRRAEGAGRTGRSGASGGTTSTCTGSPASLAAMRTRTWGCPRTEPRRAG